MASRDESSRWIFRNRGKIIVGTILCVFLLRTWPLIGILTGWNMRGAIVHIAPESSFLPPPTLPSEVRSGRSHPFFDFPKLVAEIIFLPRATRHGHVFKRDDPALEPMVSEELAEILSDPATYDPWSGEKMCGGFRADWYLRWESGQEALICEGCHEILLYRNGRVIRCDLSKSGYERIEGITRTPGTR